MASRPTNVKELIHGDPNIIGYCDAFKQGAGGVWFDLLGCFQPIIWQVEFLLEVQRSVISKENPGGSLTNFDLEMAGLLLHWLVLEGVAPLRHKMVGAYCDNTPTVAWAAKLASKKSKVAGRLLRALALCQRITQATPLLVASIAGEGNDMADIASCLFGKNSKWDCPDDDLFLTRFSASFPLPQNHSWTLFCLANRIAMREIGKLLMQPSPLDAWL